LALPNTFTLAECGCCSGSDKLVKVADVEGSRGLSKVGLKSLSQGSEPSYGIIFGVWVTRLERYNMGVMSDALARIENADSLGLEGGKECGRWPRSYIDSWQRIAWPLPTEYRGHRRWKLMIGRPLEVSKPAKLYAV